MKIKKNKGEIFMKYTLLVSGFCLGINLANGSSPVEAAIITLPWLLIGGAIELKHNSKVKNTIEYQEELEQKKMDNIRKEVSYEQNKVLLIIQKFEDQLAIGEDYADSYCYRNRNSIRAGKKAVLRLKNSQNADLLMDEIDNIIAFYEKLETRIKTNVDIKNEIIKNKIKKY